MKIYSYKNLFYAMYMFLVVTSIVNSSRTILTLIVALGFLVAMFKGLKIALVENSYAKYQDSIVVIRNKGKLFSSRYPEVSDMSYYIIFGTGVLLSILLPGSETLILGITIAIAYVTVAF